MNVPDWSTKELIDLTLIASSLDDEKKRSLAGFQALKGCDTAETFTSKSKEAWTKHFLQAGNIILNAFCRYSEEHFSEDFEAIKWFVVTSYVQKSSKITDLEEAGWYVFSKMQKASQKKGKNEKPKDVNMYKLTPTEGLFFQHYLRSVVEACIWHEAMKPTSTMQIYKDMVGNLQMKALLRLQQKTTWFPSYDWLCVDASQATAQRDRADAARMVSLAWIYVVTATNFVKMLIQRKF